MTDRRRTHEWGPLLRWALRHLGRAAILSALVAPAALVSAAPRTITKTDIRTDPPPTTHQRLRDVVWDMIEREDMRREADPHYKLDRLWFATRTRGTEVPSLCRYDTLVVEFAPIDRRQRGADTRVRAVGLRAHSRFQFLAPPADDYDSLRDTGRLPSDTDCGPLDDKADSFFRAENAEDATNGYRALHALQNALRTGSDFPLECNVFREESKATCGTRILALDSSQIGSIERCEAALGRLCYRIGNAGLEVAITVTGQVHPGPPVGQIVSARMDEMISMYHERPD